MIFIFFFFQFTLSKFLWTLPLQQKSWWSLQPANNLRHICKKSIISVGDLFLSSLTWFFSFVASRRLALIRRLRLSWGACSRHRRSFKQLAGLSTALSEFGKKWKVIEIKIFSEGSAFCASWLHGLCCVCRTSELTLARVSGELEQKVCSAFSSQVCL